MASQYVALAMFAAWLIRPRRAVAAVRDRSPPPAARDASPAAFVPPEAVLNPAVAWEDKESFDETSRQLCEMFAQNFKQYEDGMGEDLTQFGPVTAAAAATTRSSVAPLPAAAESERESSWLGGAPQPVLA